MQNISTENQVATTNGAHVFISSVCCQFLPVERTFNRFKIFFITLLYTCTFHVHNSFFFFSHCTCNAFSRPIENLYLALACHRVSKQVSIDFFARPLWISRCKFFAHVSLFAIEIADGLEKQGTLHQSSQYQEDLKLCTTFVICIFKVEMPR